MIYDIGKQNILQEFSGKRKNKEYYIQNTERTVTDFVTESKKNHVIFVFFLFEIISDKLRER